MVQAYTASSLDFGGHVTSLFTYIDGEADSEAGHMVSLVELFLKARIDDSWSLFATPGLFTFNGALLDNPASPATAGDPTFTSVDISESRVFLSRVYGEWRHSDQLVVQGGIVGSPHGTTNREYFLPARTIGQASLHTRYFLSNSLYPQIVEGWRLSGKRPLGGASLDYDAYFGVETESADDPIGGTRLAIACDCGLTVAANYGRGTRQATASPLTNFGALQSPFAAAVNLGRDYEFGGIDIDLRRGDVQLKAEAYYSAEADLEDQRALSLEGTWFTTAQLGLSYRFDYYDAGEDFNLCASAVTERGHSTEHVIGVCFTPNPSVRLRLDLHHNNLPNTEDTVDYLNFSWSFSF